MSALTPIEMPVFVSQTHRDLDSITACIQSSAELMANAIKKRNEGYDILWSGSTAEIEARLNLLGPAFVMNMFEIDADFADSVNRILAHYQPTTGIAPCAKTGKPCDVTYDPATGFKATPVALPTPDIPEIPPGNVDALPDPPPA